MNKIKSFLILLSILLTIFLAPILFTTTKISGNYGDLLLHYYPLRYLTAEHVVSGSMPLWNPYIFAGQPLLANPQSAVFYPFTLLFYILPIHIAFNYFIFFHFLIAGFFMYLLLSHFKLSNTAASAASLAYVFSSFLVYKVPLGHPAELSGYVWFPMVILGLEKIKVSDKPSWAVILAFIMSFQFLSGHVQPVYISAVFVLLHFISSRFCYWKNMLIVSGACVLFCAVQLVPTVELSQVAETGLWRSLSANYSLPLKNLINVLFPNYFGNIIDGSYVIQGNPSYFFERHSLYFGIVPAFLALSGLVMALRSKRFFWPLIIAAGFFLALGFNNPAYEVLFDNIPGLRYLRVPARFYYLVLISLVVLSAMSWDHYFKSARKTVKVILLILIVIDLFFWGKKFIFAENVMHYRRKSGISSYVDPMYRVLTEPEKIPSNKSMLYHHYNVNGYETIFVQDFTRYLGLQEKAVMGTTGLARADLFSPLSRGLSIGYHITTKVPDYGKKVADNVYKIPDALPCVFLARTLKVLPETDGYDQINYLRKTSFSPDEELMLASKPEDFPEVTEGGEIVSFARTADKIQTEILLPKPGTVVFSEISYPGWHAWSGKMKHKLYRGNKSLKTLLLPADEYTGKNRIIMHFHPVSFIFGLILTLISLISVFVFGFMSISKSRGKSFRLPS